jgi:hypothetical protein
MLLSFVYTSGQVCSIVAASALVRTDATVATGHTYYRSFL